MKKIIITLICLFTISTICFATEIGTATTDVYVRSIDTGEIVGSLAKNDRVSVVAEKNGWAKIIVNGKEYKVWKEYLDITESDKEEEVSNKIRKSKSANNNGQVKIKSKKKFKKGSEWDDIGAALYF